MIDLNDDALVGLIGPVAKNSGATGALEFRACYRMTCMPVNHGSKQHVSLVSKWTC